jgi:hypothetical protein
MPPSSVGLLTTVLSAPRGYTLGRVGYGASKQNWSVLGAVGEAKQGPSVSLSCDGNTAIVGGLGGDAAWVFTRSNGVWSRQGPKLVGTGAIGFAQRGSSVSLSGDGNTAIVGGFSDNGSLGATWVFTRSQGRMGPAGPETRRYRCHRFRAARLVRLAFR